MIEQCYLDLLKNMMLCRPVSQDIEAVNNAQDVLKKFLDERNIYNVCENINGRKTLFASTVPTRTPDYLFNAHIDVVPAISEDQYTLKIENDRLYGRGTGDDLLNAVLLVKLLCEPQKKGISAGAIFTADEEIGGSTTAGMVERGYSAKKCVVVMDSWGGGYLTIAQKGILTLKVTARGAGGHSSVPWAKENCIEKLFDAYARLKAQWIQPTAENQWGDSLALCQVNAGITHNQIPDTAEMVLNIRYTRAENQQKIIDTVANITGLEVEVLCNSLPTSSDENNEHLQRLADLISEHRQLDKKFRRMNAATDARHFCNTGIPVGITGTASNGAHSANEYALISAIEPTMQILQRFAAEE